MVNHVMLIDRLTGHPPPAELIYDDSNSWPWWSTPANVAGTAGDVNAGCIAAGIIPLTLAAQSTNIGIVTQAG